MAQTPVHDAHAARRRASSTITAAAVVLTTAGALVGCSSSPAPDHLARFWLEGDEVMTLRVEGERPTVQIEVPGLSPLQRIEWLHASGSTTFPGIPVGGDFVLSLEHDDRLVLGPGRGTFVEIAIWNARRFELENGRGSGTPTVTSAADPIASR
jgi:hypothetical protein